MSSSELQSPQNRRAELERELDRRRSLVENLLKKKKSLKKDLDQVKNNDVMSNLLNELESSKNHESVLKKELRLKLDVLQKENEGIRLNLNKLDGDVKYDENENLEGMRSELSHLRSLLTDVCGEAYEIDRKIDAIPSDAEIDQYQQRFLELDEQVGLSYSETRQSYALYNDLSTRKMYLDEFVAMFDSIIRNLPVIKSESGLKQSFLVHLDQLGKRLDAETCQHLQTSCNNEKMRLHELDQELKRCRQVHREYEMRKEKLEETFKEHEELTHELEQLRVMQKEQ